MISREKLNRFRIDFSQPQFRTRKICSGGSPTRGSRRAIDVGFFSFQASELGKVLLIVSLSAFVVDRSRSLHSRDTTVRVLLRRAR